MRKKIVKEYIAKIPRPEIIFSDDDIVVVSKPSGLLTIPDRFRLSDRYLRADLEKLFGTIFVVHRLDRDTSGVMVFARNAEAHKHLSMQFEHHNVTKKYRAIVQGQVTQDTMEIDIPLMQSPHEPGVMIASARGKQSLTILSTLERFKIATLVECQLKTGRQHQLRVHCATIGHPLLVDRLYGKAEEFRLSEVKRKYKVGKGQEERPIITRATLHAYILGFNHPSTESYCEFTVEAPKDFTAAVSLLRKYSRIPLIADTATDWESFLE